MAVSSTRIDMNPSLSPDGRRVAFASNRSGSMEIWLADLDGGNAVAVASLRAMSTVPRWSPDGLTIAFQSNREGHFDVWVVPAAGGKASNLTPDPANDFMPSFSRDGRWVYFSSTRGDGRFHVWKVAISGGPAVRVTDGKGFASLEAPDGRLYYTEGPDSAPLLRLEAGGRPPTRVVDGVVSSAFALVDGGLYYADESGRETRLMHLDLAGGRPAVVASGLGRIWPTITATPDGRTILFGRLDHALQDLMLVEGFR
jgi:dipeptidyl aminopeptidase/acylaminoacyl peptidase